MGSEELVQCQFRGGGTGTLRLKMVSEGKLRGEWLGISDGKPAKPMDTNLYHLSDAERKEQGIETLPDSLGHAIAYTEESELVKKVLGDHIFPRFVELKKKEWDDYRIQVPQYELDKYLSIL